MDIIFSSVMIYYFAPGPELAVNQGCVTTECRSFASFAAGAERSAMNKAEAGGRKRDKFNSWQLSRKQIFMLNKTQENRMLFLPIS